MVRVDKLRPLTAGQLLAIWQDEESVEPIRGLKCNARVLVASAVTDNVPTFTSPEDVLNRLTVAEIESLLTRIGTEEMPGDGGVNPQFDPARYAKMREG